MFALVAFLACVGALADTVTFDEPFVVRASGATPVALGEDVDVSVPPMPTFEPDPDHVARVLDRAWAYLGTPYRWGGRDTARHPGLDCLGLLYRAWGEVTGTPWTRFPVNPSPLVASGRLGRPVPGLDGVPRACVDLRLLRPGDVLYLLRADYRLRDEPLWIDDEDTPFWPWHTALYAGGPLQEVFHAAPGDEVRLQALDTMSFDALFVTRIPGVPEGRGGEQSGGSRNK